MSLRVAILIDGGFFLRRLPSMRPYPDENRVAHILLSIDELVDAHLCKLNETYALANARAMLYRVFYYDAHPYHDQAQLPISKRNLNFRHTPEAKLREALFTELRKRRSVALRLGTVYRERGWQLKPDSLKSLLNKERGVDDLSDADFDLGLRQKGVDMRIGMDISSLALKKQVEKIILVSGDTDFISVAKLARREGVDFILDPMWWNIPEALLEHVDCRWSALERAPVEREASDSG